jgi:hypothetical protein
MTFVTVTVPQRLKPCLAYGFYGTAEQLAEKVAVSEEIIPQWLKPDRFTTTYVWAEACTLQKPEFLRSL